MPAIITAQPKLVATAAMDRSNQNNNLVGAFIGPLAVGSSLYAALSGNSAPSFQVFKSTDGGTTWIEKDAAHEPALVFFPNYEVITASDGIYFVWDDDHNHESIRYARFDPHSDTWGPVVETPHNITSAAPFLAIARRSNGDIVVIFDDAAGNLQWGIFSHAGVWSGPSDFNLTSTQLLAVAATTGPDDSVHVVVQDLLGPFNMFYQALSPGNVVSAPQFIATLGAGNPDSFLSGFPTISTALDQIIFPFSNNAGSPDHTAMFVGSPINAPVWSQTSLETGMPAGNYAFPFAFTSPNGAILIFQTVNPGSGAPPRQLWYTRWNGATLGTPVLYYDAIANPPAAGPQDEMLKVSVGFNAASAIVAMQLTAGTPPENAFFLGGKRCLQ